MEFVIKGIVSRVESKDYYVLPEDGMDEIRCSIKGKFRKDFNMKKDKMFKSDIVTVGDYVEYDINEDRTGVIHTVEKRKNYLSRKSPKIKGASYRGERMEQVIAANIDNVVIVTSIKEPVFNNKVLDRFLVAVESSSLPAIIIVNKSDLDEDNDIDVIKDIYEPIGYDVYAVSAKNKIYDDDLKNSLIGKKNLFWGHSGVGKSSIVNMLFGLDLNTGEISNFTNKGTHTTVTAVMLKIDNNNLNLAHDFSSGSTYIIDTPGIREIDPYGIRKEDLGHYFVEFRDYIPYCRFNTCTHYHEPGCGVLAALEEGRIDPLRYDSYLRILETIEEDIFF